MKPKSKPITPDTLRGALMDTLSLAESDAELLSDIWYCMGPYSDTLDETRSKEKSINTRLRDRFGFDDSE